MVKRIVAFAATIALTLGLATAPARAAAADPCFVPSNEFICGYYGESYTGGRGYSDSIHTATLFECKTLTSIGVPDNSLDSAVNYLWHGGYPSGAVKMQITFFDLSSCSAQSARVKVRWGTSIPRFKNAGMGALNKASAFYITYDGT